MSTFPEAPSRLKPCLLPTIPVAIADLIADLTAAAERLASRLHPRTAENLADLVRVMNCYYSNLIEGHNTTPREIERALANDLDREEDQRNLQVEARAHIRLQRIIDRRFAAGSLPEPASAEFLCWLHHEFYEGAPEAMLWIEGAGRRFRMEPGPSGQPPSMRWPWDGTDRRQATGSWPSWTTSSGAIGWEVWVRG